MRILIAVHGFPPTHSAGAERQAERMAQWFMNHGHHVEIFAIELVSAPRLKLETSEQDGLLVHRVFYNVKASDNPFRNLYDNPALGDTLYDLLASRSFDLVHLISGYMLGGQVIHAAHKSGLPVAVSPMEFWFLCPQLNLIQPTGVLCSGPESDQKCMRCLMEDKRRYRRPAEIAPGIMNLFWSTAEHMPFTQATTQAVAQRRVFLQDALDSADLVICNSQFLIHKFEQFGFNTQNYQYIRQGLTTTLKPQTSAQNTNSQKEQLRLGYIGQIKYHKGVDLLVDTVIQLQDAGKAVSLDIWGNEAEAQNYATTLKTRSANYPNIHWNGSYVGAKVWDVISSIDVLVVPSRWYENSPNVILEAFEMKRPVIVTNLGGMAELVESEVSGLVFELNNIDDLQRQIERLLSEPDLLPRLKAGIPAVKRT